MAQSLEKMAKKWTWHFSPEFLHLIVGKSTMGEGIQMFGQIKADRIFEDYVVESGFSNNIWLDIASEHLVRALKSCQHSADVVMRLTKKDHMPILAVTITNVSRTGNPVYLTQEIPVKPLRWQDAEELKQPVMLDYQVHILLPPLSDLKTIVERMRGLGSHLVVSANMSGELSVRVETDVVKVETAFSSLVNPAIDPAHVDVSQQSSLYSNRQEFVHVRVDIKDFVKFLQSSAIAPKNVVCCLFEDQGLVLYVYLGDGTDADDGAFVYYIPLRHD
ncbi:checkpoint protein Hus1/Mec3 [Phlyctochytrium arcticum]|nr:checkpoint protein Hus1/Mec3 [Phlyctochytrium arcticum]